MYCTNCGNKVDENAYICVNCGVILKKENNVNKSTKKKNNNNVTGIVSIIFGVIAVILSLLCLLSDISEVGMYTKIYERIFYAFGFLVVPGTITTVSLILALIKKNDSYNKIGLVLSLISLFLVITEFVVILIY